MNDTPTAAPMHENVQPLVEQVREILDGVDSTDVGRGGWWETSTGAKFGAGKLAEVEAAILAHNARPDAGDRYATAFYEIATMLGIGAQAASPADVWRDQMRPKLEALTAQRAPAEGEKAALFQDAASLIYRVASAGAIAHEEVAFERWKNTARDLAPRLAAALAPTAEPTEKASRFDPPGLWESEPRSSADDAGKAGR